MNLNSSAVKTLVLIMGLLFILPAVPVSDGSEPGANGETALIGPEEGTLKGEDFTHNVILELFVSTTCGACPDSEERARELNYEYGSYFHYVTMVMDANEKADERSNYYHVHTLPTAIFDGGYREERSGSTDNFESYIDECGERDVVDVSLEVSIEEAEGNNINVGYRAKYTRSGLLDPLYFDCHLRVYIVEKISRYMNDRDEPIPNGFIDYAFDKDLSLISETEQSESTTWDASDCNFTNLIAIGAIFEKPGETERYVVQTASTEECGSIIFSDIEHKPEHPKHDKKVMVYCSADGDIANISVEVAPCTEDACHVPTDVPMEKTGNNTYEANIGKFGKDVVIVHYRIIANDSEGQESRSATYEFEFEDSDDDDMNEVLVYGGGSVAVLCAVLCAIFILRRKNKIKTDNE